MDIASTILGVLVPLLIHFARPSEQGERKLNDLYWQIPAGGFGALFLFKIIRAPYLVWRDENEKRKKAEDQRENLQKQLNERQPHFSAEIYRYVIGEMVHEAVRVPFILATVSIGNTGAPSIARNWSLDLELTDGRCFEGRREWIEDGTSFFDDQPSAVLGPDGARSNAGHVAINSADAIYNKTTVPIPSGGMVVGYLMVSFPQLGRDEIEKVGTKIKLIVHDIHNNQYSAGATFGGPRVPVSKAERYPGEHI